MYGSSLKGDVSELRGLVELEKLFAMDTEIYGDLEHFRVCTKMEYFKVSCYR